MRLHTKLASHGTMQLCFALSFWFFSAWVPDFLTVAIVHLILGLSLVAAATLVRRRRQAKSLGGAP